MSAVLTAQALEVLVKPTGALHFIHRSRTLARIPQTNRHQKRSTTPRQVLRRSHHQAVGEPTSQFVGCAGSTEPSGGSGAALLAPDSGELGLAVGLSAGASLSAAIPRRTGRECEVSVSATKRSTAAASRD
jgi:hypothetical protein